MRDFGRNQVCNRSTDRKSRDCNQLNGLRQPEDDHRDRRDQEAGQLSF